MSFILIRLFSSRKLGESGLTILRLSLALYFALPGRLITELRVPGIKFGFVKRPYDMGLQVLVQDLFLVDRIQSFGPGYELVICSSGHTLLDASPSCFSPTTSESRSSVNKTANTQSPGRVSPQHPIAGVNDPRVPLKSATQETDQVEYDYSVFSNDGLSTELFSNSLDQSGHALLAFSYSLLTPDSPQHPATRDQDEDEITSVGDEPNIHRVNVECTAVDAIGMLKTYDNYCNGQLLP